MSETRNRVSSEDLSFEALFEQYLSFVWRVLRTMGVPPADLEDVCQDVFVVVHRRLSDYRPDAAVTSWLYGICWRVVRDYRRRAHRRYERQAHDELPTTGTDGSQHQQAEASEAMESLSRLLERLDEDKRDVFVLYELEELPMKRVAEAVGCPLQTAYSRLHAARSQLRAVYQEDHPGGGAQK